MYVDTEHLIGREPCAVAVSNADDMSSIPRHNIDVELCISISQSKHASG